MLLANSKGSFPTGGTNTFRTVPMKMDDMEFAFTEKVGALSSEQRASFYARLANNLTIAVRWICGHEVWTDAEKVEKLARLNEIQHRVTSTVVGAGRGGDWLTDEFPSLVAFHVAADDELLAMVERVIGRTYQRVRGVPDLTSESGATPAANPAVADVS